MTDPILISKDTGVATVTLNRPDKHNAFDDQIIADLKTLFEEIDHDQQIRVMILAANGKSFSAGADLQWMQSMADYSFEQNQHDAQKLAMMLKTLNELSKPTIARVQGAAFGGAVGLVSCCDIAIGTSDASFCLSEVKVGLVPATISPYVIAAIGQRATRRYFQTAERFSADTALQLGLLSEIVATEQLDDTIISLTTNLLNNAPNAMSQSKQLIHDINGQAITPELLEQTSKLIANVRVSKEGQEGLNAFLQKRKPGWNTSNP